MINDRVRILTEDLDRQELIEQIQKLYSLCVRLQSELKHWEDSFQEFAHRHRNHLGTVIL